MLPGRKQRMDVPSEPLTGHTIVLPARFGSVITASSGTTIHCPSMRTRYCPSFDSQSGSDSAKPSASEQQRPLPLLSASNQDFSGEPAYRPSSRANAPLNAAAAKNIAAEHFKSLR